MPTRRLSFCLITLISSLGLLVLGTRAIAQEEHADVKTARPAPIPATEAAPEEPFIPGQAQPPPIPEGSLPATLDCGGQRPDTPADGAAEDPKKALDRASKAVAGAAAANSKVAEALGEVQRDLTIVAKALSAGPPAPVSCPSISHENEQCPRCNKLWDEDTALFCNPPDRWQIVPVSPDPPIPEPIQFFVPMAPVARPEAAHSRNPTPAHPIEPLRPSPTPGVIATIKRRSPVPR